MVRLTGTLYQLGSCNVLVAGDLVLDTYTIGKARRISPEAPVAVVQVQSEEKKAGGAGNVILNLLSMGAKVTAIGRVGNDSAGKELKTSLAKEGADVQGIIEDKAFQTPLKNRIIAENQQIVRVDHEQVAPLSELLEQQMIEMLPGLLNGIDVVAISDYGKGFLSRTFLSILIELSRERGIPVIADPKGIDFTKYAGATIIKPNLGEAYAAANMPSETPLAHVANKILHMTQSDLVMITLSEAGIALFHKGGKREDFPVRIREVKDVTGAGDTVLAMLACAVANRLSYDQAAQLSNIAAGLAIEHFGCARITFSELARRLLEEDVINKVFDEEHIFALKEVLKGRKCSILSISGSQGLTPGIFQCIRKLSQREDGDLIIYIHETDPEEEFVNMLASLREVDFIIVKNENLRSLCAHIKPDEIFLSRGKEIHQVDSIEDFFAFHSESVKKS